ncbi:DsrE family protein [Marimonas arenosa]|uniref:DsrE family protein n=1 Tax=Marimonas arenosa TaxID=1795305 RepID=A0AAE4B5Q7_9RHOB|nr:DsrE family protein [Marimonas arenosa]MDQ2091595.1 DsrE family protein [Marimonas arenosa]
MQLIRKLAAGVAALTLTLALTALATTADANERYGKQKVVYHINYPGGNDDKKYMGAMRNIQNHINAVGADNMEIKVVLHGNGVGLLQTAKKNMNLQGRILELKGQQVAFHVCANTLRGRNIDLNNDLFDAYEEDVVPSGVAELSYLQQQGFTYIKP